MLNDCDLWELSNGASSTVYSKYVSREHTKTPFPSYGLIIAKLRFNVCKPGSQGLLRLDFRLGFLHVLEYIFR